MAHLLQIVDSLASSPNVRLDLSDGTTWKCVSFDEGVAKLRRAASENNMGDGFNVSSSTRGGRSPIAGLQVFAASRDAAATQIQLLSRELDRTDNWLKYQQDGSSKPVFFRLFRSDYVRGPFDIKGQAAAYGCEVEFLAEPHMLGLRESIGPLTLNNDPAAVSNGHYIDITGVIGDAPSPCVLVSTATDSGYGRLAIRQHGTPSDLSFFVQGESCTLGTDTSNPGGGPDAVMSGTGTNNYVTCSFGTDATMATRVSYAFSLSDAQSVAAAGTYRLLAVVRRSDNTSVMRVRGAAAASGSAPRYKPAVALPLSTSRQMVDLGVVSAEPPTRSVGGAYNSVDIPIGVFNIYMDAARDSGAGTLDIDYLVLFPADETTLEWAVSGNGVDELVLDGVVQAAYRTENGVDPFAATSSMKGIQNSLEGTFPKLVPNQTNRLFVAGYSGASGANVITKGDTFVFTAYYWPRYLSIRPSAS